MLKFEWNALRVGHDVMVHDDSDRAFRLTPGTVAIVQTERWSNAVGVRVARDGGGSGIVWPSAYAVHLAGRPGDDCWRCESISRLAPAGAAAGPS